MAGEVADDEQGRIVEGFVVLVELPVGGAQVATFGFVLQAKKPRFQTSA